MWKIGRAVAAIFANGGPITFPNMPVRRKYFE
jgi:hypothetical protein